MSNSEELPNRKPRRLEGWDYSKPGWYFVTICVQDMRPLFGNVINGKMLLNDVGRMAHEMWLAVEHFHPEYHLDECVIMPDHVHGLVRVKPGRPTGKYPPVHPFQPIELPGGHALRRTTLFGKSCVVGQTACWLFSLTG